MKTLILVLILITTSNLVMSQSQPGGFKRKSVFAELFGNSSKAISVNFENVFSERGNLKFGYRVGIGGLLPLKESFVLPVGLVCFTGKRNSHFEFGTGLSYLYGTYGWLDGGESGVNSSLAVPISLGYRFQRPEGRFFFKANINACIDIVEFSNEPPSRVFPTPGFAIGYTL